MAKIRHTVFIRSKDIWSLQSPLHLPQLPPHTAAALRARRQPGLRHNWCAIKKNWPIASIAIPQRLLKAKPRFKQSPAKSARCARASTRSVTRNRRSQARASMPAAVRPVHHRARKTSPKRHHRLRRARAIQPWAVSSICLPESERGLPFTPDRAAGIACSCSYSAQPTDQKILAGAGFRPGADGCRNAFTRTSLVTKPSLILRTVKSAGLPCAPDYPKCMHPC